MILLIFRVFLLYFFTLFALKAMGKRQVGELQPIELVVILIISEMASLSMQSNDIPLTNSVVPIAILTVLQIILSLLNLKSEKMRAFICGRPSVIIKDGIINESEMRKLRMNINDLLEQLRSSGYFDVSAIEYALMETNGNLSVLPKINNRPVETGDLELPLAKEIPASILILDGHVNQRALNNIHKDEEWLFETLKKHNINHNTAVFIAGLDAKEKFFYQLKENVKNGSQK